MSDPGSNALPAAINSKSIPIHQIKHQIPPIQIGGSTSPPSATSPCSPLSPTKRRPFPTINAAPPKPLYETNPDVSSPKLNTRPNQTLPLKEAHSQQEISKSPETPSVPTRTVSKSKFPPPPMFDLPTPPTNNSSIDYSRPISPPPMRVPVKSPPTSPPNSLRQFDSSSIDRNAISSLLGPPPSHSAPSPAEDPSSKRDKTPPLPSHLSSVPTRSNSSGEPLKRTGSPAARSIDLSGYERQSAQSKSTGRILSVLSRTTSGKGLSQTSNDAQQSSNPEVEKLRVHYRHLANLPDNHFAPTPPEFSPQSHRDRVAFEFFTSELSYNNFLKILVEVFRTPVINAQKSGDLSCKEDEVKKVFGSIEAIHAASDIILLALEEKIRTWDPNNQVIGDVFIKYGDLLRVYATFSREQQNSKIALDNCMQRTTFVNLLKISQQFPACQSRDLGSLTIMPIQRIPRYELLLRDFIKATPSEHPDAPLLQQALQKVKKVAEQVDTAVEEYKQLEKMLSIQKSFSSSVNLVIPGRRFIKEGPLVKVCRRANKTRMFWLFNDTLFYGIPILTGTFVISAELPLISLRLQDLQDVQSDDIDQPSNSPNGRSGNDRETAASTVPNQSSKPQFAFLIQSRSKSFVVFASSNQEKVDWMVAIMTAATECADNRRTILADGAVIDDQVAPAWQPDDAAISCVLCKSSFGIVTRKHHCRRCGTVVCDDCSKTRTILPGLGEKQAVRICDRCVLQTPIESSSSNPNLSRLSQAFYDISIFKS